MFGFNVGVTTSYAKVAKLLRYGVQAYASPSSWFLNIVPSESDFVDDNEHDYLEQATQLNYSEKINESVIPIEIEQFDNPEYCLSNQDFPLEKTIIYNEDGVNSPTPSANELALTVESFKNITHAPTVLDAVPLSEPIKSVKDKTAELAPVEVYIGNKEISQKIEAQPKVQSYLLEAQEETKRQEVSAVQPPDISGMTLKGQLQTIAKYTNGTRTAETVLFEAFGKSTILKLISEGYLVKTKKGIVLGS